MTLKSLFIGAKQLIEYVKLNIHNVPFHDLLSEINPGNLNVGRVFKQSFFKCGDFNSLGREFTSEDKDNQVYLDILGLLAYRSKINDISTISNYCNRIATIGHYNTKAVIKLFHMCRLEKVLSKEYPVPYSLINLFVLNNMLELAYDNYSDTLQIVGVSSYSSRANIMRKFPCFTGIEVSRNGYFKFDESDEDYGYVSKVVSYTDGDDCDIYATSFEDSNEYNCGTTFLENDIWLEMRSLARSMVKFFGAHVLREIMCAKNSLAGVSSEYKYRKQLLIEGSSIKIHFPKRSFNDANPFEIFPSNLLFFLVHVSPAFAQWFVYTKHGYFYLDHSRNVLSFLWHYDIHVHHITKTFDSVSGWVITKGVSELKMEPQSIPMLYRSVPIYPLPSYDLVEFEDLELSPYEKLREFQPDGEECDSIDEYSPRNHEATSWDNPGVSRNDDEDLDVSSEEEQEESEEINKS